MTTLEAWKPDESLLSTDKKSSSSERVLTKFVSTATEESMLESAPKDIAWPSVRDGKTEGYMLVHAITDRTGQVREASSYSSDNPGVEDRGRAIALQYKFKPLVVDGVPQQMEMPLAIHFVTRIENPIPELDDLTSRKIIRGCSLPHEMKFQVRIEAFNVLNTARYGQPNGNCSASATTTTCGTSGSFGSITGGGTGNQRIMQFGGRFLF